MLECLICILFGRHFSYPKILACQTPWRDICAQDRWLSKKLPAYPSPTGPWATRRQSSALSPPWSSYQIWYLPITPFRMYILVMLSYLASTTKALLADAGLDTHQSILWTWWIKWSVPESIHRRNALSNPKQFYHEQCRFTILIRIHLEKSLLFQNHGLASKWILCSLCINLTFM